MKEVAAQHPGVPAKERMRICAALWKDQKASQAAGEEQQS
jgi:hypothetical protein